MPSNYKNQSLMIPFRLWVMPSTRQFRIELPSLALTTPTEWKFDTRISSIPAWKPWREGNPYLYGISITSFPPSCRGADLIHIVQSMKYPYNTDYVIIGAFLEREKVTIGPYVGRELDQMYMFIYSVPNTLLLYVWAHIDMYNNLTYNMEIDPAIDDEETHKKTIGKWIHLSLYPFLSEMHYWKSTTESLCIPASSHNPKDPSSFYTLRECQEKTYSNLRNRHTWVGTNSEPLYKYMKWWEKQSTDQKLSSFVYKQF